MHGAVKASLVASLSFLALEVEVVLLQLWTAEQLELEHSIWLFWTGALAAFGPALAALSCFSWTKRRVSSTHLECLTVALAAFLLVNMSLLGSLHFPQLLGEDPGTKHDGECNIQAVEAANSTFISLILLSFLTLVQLRVRFVGILCFLALTLHVISIALSQRNLAVSCASTAQLLIICAVLLVSAWERAKASGQVSNEGSSKSSACVGTSTSFSSLQGPSGPRTTSALQPLQDASICWSEGMFLASEVPSSSAGQSYATALMKLAKDQADLVAWLDEDWRVLEPVPSATEILGSELLQDFNFVELFDNIHHLILRALFRNVATTGMPETVRLPLKQPGGEVALTLLCLESGQRCMAWIRRLPSQAPIRASSFSNLQPILHRRLSPKSPPESPRSFKDSVVLREGEPSEVREADAPAPPVDVLVGSPDDAEDTGRLSSSLSWLSGSLSISNESQGIETDEKLVQTDLQDTMEIGINTETDWAEMGLTCIRCQRPPMPPGHLQRAKEIRSMLHSRGRTRTRSRSRRSALDAGAGTSHPSEELSGEQLEGGSRSKASSEEQPHEDGAGKDCSSELSPPSSPPRGDGCPQVEPGSSPPKLSRVGSRTLCQQDFDVSLDLDGED